MNDWQDDRYKLMVRREMGTSSHNKEMRKKKMEGKRETNFRGKIGKINCQRTGHIKVKNERDDEGRREREPIERKKHE